MIQSQETHYCEPGYFSISVDITGTDISVIDSHNIQLNNSLGVKILPGHIVKLCGSALNNGYFVVQKRIGDQAPYKFKLGKSYSCCLDSAELLIAESGNSSLRLQSWR